MWDDGHQMLDRYWLETAEFVKAQPGGPYPVIGPREMSSAIAEITPYERASFRLLERPCYFVVHKGLVNEIDEALLYSGMLAGELVFSNDVFLVLEITGRATHHLPQTTSVVAALTRGASVSAPARIPCYLGESRALCKSIHGHKLLVDTRDLSLTPHLLTDGYWEMWITDFIKRTVEPGMSVVEVGANYGYYTLLLADLVGSAGQVTAFEANPTVASLLFTSIEINGFADRVRAEQAVVSDAGGKQVKFKIWKKHIASSGLFASAEEAERFHDAIEETTLTTVALDKYFPSGTKVDFIKMDAEGAEPLIIRGADRLFQENQVIRLVVEFVPKNIAWTIEPDAFLDLLRSSGFRIYRIDEDATAREKDRTELLSKPHSELFLERSV